MAASDTVLFTHMHINLDLGVTANALRTRREQVLQHLHDYVEMVLEDPAGAMDLMAGGPCDHDFRGLAAAGAT